MKYTENKLRLNEIASVMKSFYFLVKFGLILIYILKVYCKKSSSILLRKKHVQFITYGPYIKYVGRGEGAEGFYWGHEIF